MNAGIRHRTGIRFLSDAVFWAAIGAGAATATAMAPWLAPHPAVQDAFALLSFVCVQPLVEECIFRGLLQPWLARTMRARIHGSISAANLLTSLLFVLAHLPSHPPPWAMAVLLPSLAFGYFRERHGHIGSAVMLHMAYNAFYLTASL